MSGVGVRLATPADRNSLVALRADPEFRRLNESESADNVSEHHLAHLLLDFASKRPDFALLLATEGDRAIGMIVVHPRDIVPGVEYSDDRTVALTAPPPVHVSPAIAELDEFYVVEGARGRGVGAALIRAAIDEAHTMNYDDVTMHSSNPAALRAARKGGLHLDG